MATSAFRSTTRRSDCAGKAEVSGGGLLVVPSTPTHGDGRRSRRDPSPSPSINRGHYGGKPSASSNSFHRRSTSMSDFSSAKYLSDCSSTTAFRSASTSRNYRSSSGIKGGTRSVCPSDSESDMECLSAHRPLRKFVAESEDERQPRRRWGAESEDERNVRPPFSTINVVDRQSKGMRRASSSHDFSQYNNKQRHTSIVSAKKDEQDDAEDLAEEKTIRAVFAQMKSLQSDPPVGDVGMNGFLDAMRSEVKRAVADIRMELEESMRKNSDLASTFGEENGSESQGTDVTLAVAEIRKEYSTKLEESEKRVQELWSQIAVEERRCLELSKIVKELLPTPPPPTTSASHTSSNRRRPLRRKNSSEKQHVLKSLDDEAQKYFDECVSISSLDCPADSDDSMREKENKTRYRKGRSGDPESTAKSGLSQADAKGGPSKKDFLIGSDGVVLPWLQWEAEAAGGNESSPSQGLKKHLGKSINGNVFDRLSPGANNQFGRNTNLRPNVSRKSGASRNLSESLLTESHVEPLFTEYKPVTMQTGNKSSSMSLQTGKSSNISLFTVDDHVAEENYPLIDEDTSLLERIRFRCRVENGELLLCQGLFLM